MQPQPRELQIHALVVQFFKQRGLQKLGARPRSGKRKSDEEEQQQEDGDRMPRSNAQQRRQRRLGTRTSINQGSLEY